MGRETSCRLYGGPWGAGNTAVGGSATSTCARIKHRPGKPGALPPTLVNTTATSLRPSSPLRLPHAHSGLTSTTSRRRRRHHQPPTTSPPLPTTTASRPSHLLDAPPTHRHHAVPPSSPFHDEHPLAASVGLSGRHVRPVELLRVPRGRPLRRARSSPLSGRPVATVSATRRAVVAGARAAPAARSTTRRGHRTRFAVAARRCQQLAGEQLGRPPCSATCRTARRGGARAGTVRAERPPLTDVPAQNAFACSLQRIARAAAWGGASDSAMGGCCRWRTCVTRARRGVVINGQGSTPPAMTSPLCKTRCANAEAGGAASCSTVGVRRSLPRFFFY